MGTESDASHTAIQRIRDTVGAYQRQAETAASAGAYQRQAETAASAYSEQAKATESAYREQARQASLAPIAARLAAGVEDRSRRERDLERRLLALEEATTPRARRNAAQSLLDFLGAGEAVTDAVRELSELVRQLCGKLAEEREAPRKGKPGKAGRKPDPDRDRDIWEACQAGKSDAAVGREFPKKTGQPITDSAVRHACKRHEKTRKP